MKKKKYIYIYIFYKEKRKKKNGADFEWATAQLCFKEGLYCNTGFCIAEF